MRPGTPPNATQPATPANSGTKPQPSSSQPPAAQPSLEELGPPTPPQVAYRDGELTVRALNSTLESVLNAIRSKAGIQFEGLESGAPERVAIAMGPAPEGEVLAALLGGSRFDYVAVDRPDSPGIVQRVVLTPRPGAAAAAVAQRQTSSSPSAMESSDEDEVPDEGGNADPDAAPQDTPARPPVMQAQPQMRLNPPPQQQQPQNQQLQNQQPQPETSTPKKTPEQLLEDLKQMQQRQQQQQQQQQQRSTHDEPPQ